MSLDVSRRNPAPRASKEYGTAQEEQAEVAQIVQGCRRRDRAARRRLYDLFHKRVYALSLRLVGFQDASDLLQQVFLQVFRKIDRFAGESKFETWLYRVTVNECLQHLRRDQRGQHAPLSYEPIDPSSCKGNNVEDKELLEQALQRIEPELRTIFLLREIDGLSYRQIAEVMSIPEGTVGSRLNRARRELKVHLVELGWEAAE